MIFIPVVWLITWGIYCTILKPLDTVSTALRKNHVVLQRFCFCQLGPKVTKSANSGLPRKGVFLGQRLKARPKWILAVFIWHHGGANY
jgi:hypothetical protein